MTPLQLPMTPLLNLPWTFLNAAAHGGAEAGGIDPIHNLINFLLVFFALAFIVKKFKVFSVVDVQRMKVAQEIEQVEAQKKKALEELETVKRRTQNLTQEVEEILQTAKNSAEGLAAQILENAQAESTKILEASKRRVELEQRSAVKTLEARLLNDALQTVREDLTRSLTPEDQERSVETFLEELSQIKSESA
jgi:F-type H+-transporting ATPase subunit b